MGFVNPSQSWLGSWVAVFGHRLWCCPTFAGCLWCSWLGLGFGLLMGRVWFGARFAWPPDVSGSGVRCGRACWAWVSAVPRPSWLDGPGVFFALFFFFALWCRLLGVPVPGLVVCPPIPFLSGWAAGFFFLFVVCVCMFRCPFSRWAAVPGLVLPVLAGWSPCASFGVLSSVPSGWGAWPPFVLLAGGLVALGCFRAPPPPPPVFFFFGGLGLPVSPSALLCWRTHCGWCVVWLVPRHSWRRFLCATPEAVPRTPWLGYGIQPVSGPLTPSTEGKTGLRSTNPMYRRRPLTPGASPTGACSVP